MKITIFGYGSVGSHLAALFAQAGHAVTVCVPPGSTRQRALPTASFADGARTADLIVLAVPFGSVRELLAPLTQALAGKVVVDCTNPVNADWSPMLLGEENSAAETVARLLPKSRVVKAFNTIFADVMTPERQLLGGQRISAFVAGDDAVARQTVMALAESSGFAVVDVGALRWARQLEAIAHLNIHLALGLGGGTHAAFLYHQVRA